MIVRERSRAADEAGRASEQDQIGGNTQVIRAELIGSDTCTAVGITVRVGTPVLTLCRRLIEVGYDAATPLLVYRGEVLALTIRSIGQAARLEINSKGTGFIRHRAVRTAPPVRRNAPAHARWPGYAGSVGSSPGK